ncbi:LirA/MavJ family T4SS effector [Cystobacter fuscus]
MEKEWALKERMTLRTTPKDKKEGSRHPTEQTIIGADGPLIFQKQFLREAVKQAVPIRDIGAPASHGEYAHRIQWYIIAYYFLEVWSAKGIRYVHHAMGRLRFLQALAVPKRQDDGFRSLWDYVVDVRLDEAAEVGDTGDVYAASPVRLTSRLLGYDFITQRNTLGSPAVQFKTIARAVASKRRKRVLEGKVRDKKALTDLERQHLSDEGGRAAREEWLQKTFSELFS